MARTVLRVAALGVVAIALTSCTLKPRLVTGVYAGLSLSETPNAAFIGRPRYVDVVNDRQAVVYFPVRTGEIHQRKASRLAWASQTWTLTSLPDRAPAPGMRLQCCYYGLSSARESKGMIRIFHAPYGYVIAWFAPHDGRQRDFLHTGRTVPRAGSPYSFTPARITIKV